MGKKGHNKSEKKKMTKKEKKAANHLKLVKGNADNGAGSDWNKSQDGQKKSA